MPLVTESFSFAPGLVVFVWFMARTAAVGGSTGTCKPLSAWSLYLRVLQSKISLYPPRLTGNDVLSILMAVLGWKVFSCWQVVWRRRNKQKDILKRHKRFGRLFRCQPRLLGVTRSFLSQFFFWGGGLNFHFFKSLSIWYPQCSGKVPV